MDNVKHYLKRVLPLAFLLIVLDQVVKLIIWNNFFDYRFYFIGEIIGFYPVINTSLSWLGHYISFLRSPLIIAAINVVVLVVVSRYYIHYLQTEEKPLKIVHITFVFALASCICSFIDKLFWGGSLDFIYITGLFVLDLKDLYIMIAQFLLICIVIFTDIFSNKKEEQNTPA